MIYWLNEDDALMIHQEVIAAFGGSDGVRDFGLLQSALAKPQHLHHYTEHISLTALAASYAFGIVKNHPFIDGNKRVGLGVCDLFLKFNGFEMLGDNQAARDSMLQLASSEITEAEFAHWLAQNTQPL